MGPYISREDRCSLIHVKLEPGRENNKKLLDGRRKKKPGPKENRQCHTREKNEAPPKNPTATTTPTPEPRDHKE
jgi:hypothetical protein